MKVYVDEETGYLIIEDISEGIKIMSNKRYLDIQERLSHLIEAEKWAKKLWEEAEHNNAVSDWLIEENRRLKEENKQLIDENKQLIYALGVSDGVNRAVGYFGGKMNNPCVLGAKGKKVYNHMIKNKEVFKKRIPEIAQKYEFEDD